MHDDRVRRKMLIMVLTAIILNTAFGRIIGAVAHNAALGFVASVVLGWLSFSLIFLWLRRQ